MLPKMKGLDIMEKFVAPRIEIVAFENEDVLTSSIIPDVDETPVGKITLN